MSRVHVVFGDSAAGTLRQVLAARGTADRVVSLGDDLSWGPIGPDSAKQRIDHFEAECPIPGGWSWLAETHQEFWQQVAESRDERLIWLGSKSPRELADYLAYLDRCHDYPARVIRPDEHIAPHPVHGPAGSVGVLNPGQVADVLEHAGTRPVSEDEEMFGRWPILVSERALLRVLDGDRLVSAPIDHFDHLILGVVAADWKPAVRVVGDAMGAAFDARLMVNSDLLFSRLSQLAKSGTLEADGDVLGWTENMRRSPTNVRTPARRR